MDNKHIAILTDSNEILIKKDHKWESLNLPEKDKPIQIDESENLLVVNFSSGKIGLYSFEDENWNLVNIGEPIIKTLSNNKKVLLLLKSGKMKLLENGGELKEFKMDEEGRVTSFVKTENDFFLSTFPNFYWKKIKK